MLQIQLKRPLLVPSREVSGLSRPGGFSCRIPEREHSPRFQQQVTWLHRPHCTSPCRLITGSYIHLCILSTCYHPAHSECSGNICCCDPSINIKHMLLSFPSFPPSFFLPSLPSLLPFLPQALTCRRTEGNPSE